jgi:hypothetical protein
VADSKVTELVLNALKELHRKSDQPETEQWFRRAEIARQLGTPSNHLNPARIGVLEALVKADRVSKEQKPNDARDLPLYRIP